MKLFRRKLNRTRTTGIPSAIWRHLNEAPQDGDYSNLRRDDVILLAIRLQSKLNNVRRERDRYYQVKAKGWRARLALWVMKRPLYARNITLLEAATSSKRNVQEVVDLLTDTNDILKDMEFRRD